MNHRGEAFGEAVVLTSIVLMAICALLAGRADSVGAQPSPHARAYQETIAEYTLMNYVCGLKGTTKEVATTYDTLSETQQQQVAWRIVNMMRAFADRDHSPKFCQCDRCQGWLKGHDYLMDRCKEALDSKEVQW